MIVVHAATASRTRVRTLGEEVSPVACVFAEMLRQDSFRGSGQGLCGVIESVESRAFAKGFRSSRSAFVDERTEECGTS